MSSQTSLDSAFHVSCGSRLHCYRFNELIAKVVVVTDTTRSPRPGEENGVAYHFVARERFQELIKQVRYTKVKLLRHRMALRMNCA